VLSSFVWVSFLRGVKKMQPGVKPYEVLLVEDNPADIGLMREAFKHVKTPMKLNVAGDGEKAMEFLRRTGESKNSPVADLVLLDLKLPKKSGHEVLKEIKGDVNLKSIPVLIVTTSHSKRDIRLSYENYANAYVTKPEDLDDFMHVAQAIDDFWFHTAARAN
jgi:two-component system, chemotaxis family, response regulator Rcp1